MNRTIFISLRTKMLILFTLLFTAAFTVLFIWSYNHATHFAMGRIQEDLLAALLTAAGGIDADELVALYEEGAPNESGFSDDPRYIRQLEWFQVVHDIEPRAWPYTYVKGPGENEIIFIADLWARYDHSKSVRFLESYIGDGTLIRSLNETTFKDNFNPYTDKWGAWVSGYTPIRNATGESVGGVGVDFEAYYVYEVQQITRNKVLIAFTATYVVMFVLVYLASSTISRPLADLSMVAKRISEGDYEQDLSHFTTSRFSDEIDTLAHMLNIMVNKINLRAQERDRAEAALIKTTESMQQLSQQIVFAREAERQRIAHELHDGILNELVALRMSVDDFGDTAQLDISYLKIIGHIRQIVDGLRPPMLAYGLWIALEELVASLATRGDAIPIIRFETTKSETRYEAQFEQNIYQIVKQACENTMRHAKAQTLRIAGHLDPDAIELTVEDDGEGFEIGEQPDLLTMIASKSYGLAEMFERANIIGAEVQIDSAPGRGTRVRIRWSPNQH